MTVPSLFELASVVYKAGAIINENFGIPHGFTAKEVGSPVTAIDHQVNTLFKDFAEQKKIGFIGEEGNGNVGSDWILYVDPLDGTGAFTRGMATSTVIASIMFMGEPTIAIIHNPMTGQTWAAEETTLCEYWRGESKAKVVNVIRDPSSYYRTAICAWPGVDERFETFQRKVLESSLFSDQQMGAFGIGGGLIASGLIHATAISSGSAGETAAMSLIVKEAGGVAVDLNGSPIERFEFGIHKGKEDFLLPRGAILASDIKVAEALLQLY